MSQAKSAAADLLGRQLPGGWRVVEKVLRAADASGGAFSESYVVEDDNGRRGFLKAFDYSRALTMPETPKVLAWLTAAFLYEADLMKQCAGARLSRIVLAIADGEIDVEGHPISRVNYLIFELADRDIRAHIQLSAQLDVAWALRALHHVATGLGQLHRQDITHHDVKPSNILVFPNLGAKIGDLGRASRHGVVAPHDELPIPGDKTYSPPELLYGFVDPDLRRRRRASDMHQLGSLLLFLFTGESTTAALEAEIDLGHHWRAWKGKYDDVLPYLRDAFDRMVERLEVSVPAQVRAGVVDAFRKLSDPDPRLRGDPTQVPGSITRYSLERFVSAFDLLARHAEIQITRPAAS